MLLSFVYATLFLIHCAQSRSECYLVYGTLVCEGNHSTVSNITVDLIDDDGLIDDHIGQTQTSANGTFSVTGCGYDPLPFNTPDPYVKIVHRCDRGSNYTQTRTLEISIFPVPLPKVQNVGKLFLDIDS